ncbi:MAG: hypothetical protein PHH83_05005 [Patescibacteria group bacterium]|nr:hypothetical protein [Patescibacteria group bacterium]
MNKKGQIPYMQEIFAVIVLLALIPVFTSLFNQNCPECDCSSYQNQLETCNQKLQNPEIIYVNQTIEVPVEKIVEKPVYLTDEGRTSEIIVSISLILSFFITLFSFKIKLPRHLEEKLNNLEEIIKIIKFGSLILTILIFIKLLIVFNLIGV